MSKQQQSPNKASQRDKIRWGRQEIQRWVNRQITEGWRVNTQQTICQTTDDTGPVHNHTVYTWF